MAIRVLVTGGAGFIGRHVVQALTDREHEVTVVDNLSRGTTEPFPLGTRFVRTDIRLPLDDLMMEVKPEVVLHLAAQTSVPDSVRDPLGDESVNVGGTINLIRSAAPARVRKLVMISSAAVYGAPKKLPLLEDSLLAPLSPYGLSKCTGESYVRMLCDLYGIAHTILRPANIYGPGQTTEGEGAVVPAFLQAFMAGKDPIIQGDGSQTRDMLFVGDMVRALLLAMERGDGMTLNISTGKQVTILDLWRHLARRAGWQREPAFGPPRMGDILHSVMAETLARQHLGWAPQVSMPEGLDITVEWWNSRKTVVERGGRPG